VPREPCMKKSGKANEPQAAAAMEPLTDARSHTECFARAMKLFSQGDFVRAREVFEMAANGPVMSVNESASMYARMCDQRLERQRLEYASPGDLYNRASALLKQRQYAEALTLLEASQRAEDTARVRYALALASGHIGDPSAAARQLKHACDLDPALRETARRDPEFQSLLQFAEIRDALAEHA